MNAADVMTRNVVTVGADASIGQAIALMLDHRLSGLPVLASDGELVGILTEGDLLRRTETGTERQRPRWLEFLRGPGRLAEDYVQTHGRKVGEIMTEDVVSVGEDRSPRSSGSWNTAASSECRCSVGASLSESSAARI